MFHQNKKILGSTNYKNAPTPLSHPFQSTSCTWLASFDDYFQPGQNESFPSFAFFIFYLSFSSHLPLPLCPFSLFFFALYLISCNIQPLQICSILFSSFFHVSTTRGSLLFLPFSKLIFIHPKHGASEASGIWSIGHLKHRASEVSSIRGGYNVHRGRASVINAYSKDTDLST
jgi:hypothetical protein